MRVITIKLGLGLGLREGGLVALQGEVGDDERPLVGDGRVKDGEQLQLGGGGAPLTVGTGGRRVT